MPGCAICEEHASSEAALDLGNGWSVSIPSGRAPLLGWVTIHPLVHRASPDELSIAEAASLGPLLTGACAFLRARTGAARMYVANWAEATPHVHFHLIPRALDLAPDLRGAGIFQLFTPIDRESWPSVEAQRKILRGLRDHVRELG